MVAARPAAIISREAERRAWKSAMETSPLSRHRSFAPAGAVAFVDPSFGFLASTCQRGKSDAWIGLRLRSECHVGDLSAAPAPRRMADRTPLARRVRWQWAGTVRGPGRGWPRFVTRVRRCRAGFEDDRRRFASGSNARDRQRRLRTIAHVRSCSKRPLSHGYTVLHWKCPTDVGTRGVATAPPMAAPHCLIGGGRQG
jgi:hypothetical protein